jgi:hypothetical protein
MGKEEEELNGMKRINRNSRKIGDKIKIDYMDENTSKIYISTSDVTAVKEQDKVRNYEDYINDKYLTGAIVNKRSLKKTKIASIENN